MRRLLGPVVEEDLRRHQAVAGAGSIRNEAAQRRSDAGFPMTEWLMARYKAEEATPGQIAHDLIVASFESTPSMAGTLFMLLSELVIRPEVVEELREELALHMVDGRLPQTTLGELKKLDSVMRESARINPFGYRTSHPIPQA
jgi:cytochrome P450